MTAKEYPDCSFIDKVTFGYENWKDIFGTVDEYSIELVGLCTDICVVSNALALRMFYRPGTFQLMKVVVPV